MFHSEMTIGTTHPIFGFKPDCLTLRKIFYFIFLFLQKRVMTREELLERQSWSLERKIDHSLGVIEDFHARLSGKVAVSFSGGKDSTVLYWLARKVFPEMKGVFCNTGNEYPDIVKFVRGMREEGCNIDIIYPEKKPREVISEYGFPLISKETSQRIWYAKHKPESCVAKIGLGEIGGGQICYS